MVNRQPVANVRFGSQAVLGAKRKPRRKGVLDVPLAVAMFDYATAIMIHMAEECHLDNVR